VSIRLAYLAMIRAFPGGWDAMCAALGMSRDALENRIYERKGQGLRVDTALQMQAFSGVADFAQAVAFEAGGVFLRLPSVLPGEDEVLDEFLALVSQNGRLAQILSDARRDGVIEPGEFEVLEREAQKVHALLARLLATIKNQVRDVPD